MRAVDIIQKKKHGEELSNEEIKFFISGYVDRSIADYQMSALCMAWCLKGMSQRELSTLTQAMTHSGSTFDFSEINGFVFDKHSSGGVGDKITLIVAPLAAACGLKVAKMSGRGLGHTGGTIDKLDSIEGLITSLDVEHFHRVVNEVGCAVTGQTESLAVADKMMYALRDVTATVDDMNLIASSIMSKKLAMHSDALILDVKMGDGALMKNRFDAQKLAQLMVRIGKDSGRNIRALITDMNQPLGYAIGNSLEVQESIDTLQGNGPHDVTTLSIETVAHALVMAKKAQFIEDARRYVQEVLESGKAFDVFMDMLIAQGVKLVNRAVQLPVAQHQFEVIAKHSGFVMKMDTEHLGVCAMKLGAGRMRKEDTIDYSAGVLLRKKVGDLVMKGDILAVVHSNNNCDSILATIESCIHIGEDKIDTMLIHEVLV